MLNRELSQAIGSVFVVSDAFGNISPGEAHGIFAADTRHLSRYELRLTEWEPIVLQSGSAGCGETVIYATNPGTDSLPAHSVEILRRQRLNSHFVDSIEIINGTTKPLLLPVSLIFAADFADIFEVRSVSSASFSRRTVGRSENGQILFYDRRRKQGRTTRVRFSQKPTSVRGGTARFAVRLQPQESWTVNVEISWTIPQLATTRPIPICPADGQELALAPSWQAPTLITDDADLQIAYETAVTDLTALNIQLDNGQSIVAAGLPWFVAIFGRDSLITSIQTLLLGPQLAQGTLDVLAAYQATRRSAFRDAEPGKIPHEVRFGELATSKKLPHDRYYGTVDATPLWLILLAEQFGWTRDREILKALLPAAERALRWIDEHADLDGDGLVEYQRGSRYGLDNQGWKDSWDSIRFADGRLAEPPIALIEVQGYVYAAKMAMATVYATLGRHDQARTLQFEAERLKALIHEAFWLPDQGFYALALDQEKRPVDSLTSNPGHLLWSGAIGEPYAGQVVERLMTPDFFSGWGIRTMASTMAAYRPISYHNGSVWPHDNSLLAAGFRRYGYHREAQAIIDSLIDATRSFDRHRLPELFCGYDRHRAPFPVKYPMAASPQAWAAGSVILMVQLMAGIEPRGEGLHTDPLPHGRTLHLEGLTYQNGRRESGDAVSNQDESPPLANAAA